MLRHPPERLQLVAEGSTMFQEERIPGAGKIIGRRYRVPDVVQWLCDRDVAALNLDY